MVLLAILNKEFGNLKHISLKTHLQTSTIVSIVYEEFDYINNAIDRETELKKWNREKKENLIDAKNPEWRELVNERGFIRQ